MVLSNRNSERHNLTVDEVKLIASQCVLYNNFEIIDFSIEPFSSEKLGYLGDYKLLTIEVLAKSDGAPKKKLQFFVKTQVPNSNDFDNYIFCKESKFFRDVMPMLMKNHKGESWAPRCYLVQHNSIVLEDLKVLGYKTGDKKLTPEQLRAAVCTTARYHASSILLEAKMGISLKDLFPKFSKEKIMINDDEYSWKWFKAGIKVAEAVAKRLALNSEHASAAYDLALEKIQPDGKYRNVLCHNDLWLRNLMFKEADGETSCRLIDFQMASYASLAVDLLQILYLNTTKDVRDELEGHLLELYHKVLQEHVERSGIKSEIISLQQVQDSVRDKRICGLVTAIQFFPFTLLNDQKARELMEDSEALNRYNYEDRVDFVFKAMEEDEDYCVRIKESVTELIDYMGKCSGD